MTEINEEIKLLKEKIIDLEIIIESFDKRLEGFENRQNKEIEMRVYLQRDFLLHRGLDLEDGAHKKLG